MLAHRRDAIVGLGIDYRETDRPTEFFWKPYRMTQPLTVTSAAPQLHDGGVKGCAVSGAYPAAGLPLVPLAASLPALRGIAMEGWQALFAPARTPPEVVARIAAGVTAFLAEPKVREKLESLGMTPGTVPREAMQGFLVGEGRATRRSSATATSGWTRDRPKTCHPAAASPPGAPPDDAARPPRHG